MALMTSSTTELAHQYATNYSKTLLPRARQLTVLDQFATKFNFPKNAGAKTMRMFRQEAGAASDLSALTEGVPLTTYTEVGLDYVEATLAQYGILIKQSDILSMTDLVSTLMMSRERISESAALHADSIVRNVLANPTSGIATNKIYGSGTADWTTLAGYSDASQGVLTIEDLLRAMTILKLARAPKKNGEYFAIVDPRVAYDLMKDTKWFIPVNTYQDKSMVVKGEVGKWFNIRIVETTVPWREATGGAQGTFSSSGGIYLTIVTGADAFGTPIMAGNSPYNPHVYVHQGADKADPLNQYTLVGAKTYWATAVLNELWAVAIRSRTTFA